MSALFFGGGAAGICNNIGAARQPSSTWTSTSTPSSSIPTTTPTTRLVRFHRPTTTCLAVTAAAAAAAASNPDISPSPSNIGNNNNSNGNDSPRRSSARARAIAPPAVGRSSSVEVATVPLLAHLQSPPSSSTSTSSSLADAPAPPSTPLRCPRGFVAPSPSPGFDSITSALEAVARGEFVVVLDDADRENEGDLILAADAATKQKIAFMVEETSGVLCVGLPGAACDRLSLPLMVPPQHNEDAMRTAFTVTVDSTEGISTGISAADRARTIRLLAGGTERGDVDVSVSGGGADGDDGENDDDDDDDDDEERGRRRSTSSCTSTTSASDLRRPGHVFPLRAHPGGVRSRPGHTEAAVDLSTLAGRRPAGLLCEIVDRSDGADPGSMARTPRLLEFSREASLKCITIADLVAFMDARDAAIAAEEEEKNEKKKKKA